MRSRRRLKLQQPRKRSSALWRRWWPRRLWSAKRLEQSSQSSRVLRHRASRHARVADRDGTHWAEGAPSTGRAWPQVSPTVPQPAVITAPDRKGPAPRFRARLGGVGHRLVRGPAGLQKVPGDTSHRPCLACSSSAVGSACLLGIIIKTNPAKTSAPVPTAMTTLVGAEPPRPHAISTRLRAIPEPRSLRDWHHAPGPGLMACSTRYEVRPRLTPR